MSRHHDAAGWRRVSPQARARIRAAGQVQACQRCGRPIDLDGEAWDAGHVVDLMDGGDTQAVGPEHRHCNRSDGGKRGAALTRGTRRTAERMPSW